MTTIAKYHCKVCNLRFNNVDIGKVNAHRGVHNQGAIGSPRALTDDEGLKLKRIAHQEGGRLSHRTRKALKRGSKNVLAKRLQELERENTKLRSGEFVRVVVKARIKVKTDHPFYDSREWMKLKYRALTVYGRTCMCCRATEGEMHVDHIKPRSLYPQLALDFDNLQILCKACNLGKGNTDCVDYRPHKRVSPVSPP